MGVKFDIIIPVMSTPLNLFRATLDSILAQTCQDFNLWICDATPESWIRWDAYQSLIRDYQTRFGDRWQYVRQDSEKFPGVSGARNQIMAMGSAPYLAFLDSDDEWNPNYLSKMLRALETQEADIWVTEIMSHVATNHLVDLTRVGITEEIGMEKIMHNHLQCYEVANFLPAEYQKYFWISAAAFFSGLVCHRHCVDTHQFSPDFKLGEDTELMVRWIKAGYQVRSLSVEYALVTKKEWAGQLGKQMADPEIMQPIGELFVERHGDCYVSEADLAKMPYSAAKTIQMFQKDSGARDRYQINQGLSVNFMSKDDWEILNL